MRILRIIPSVNLACGGPVEGLFQSSEVLSQMGHESEILSLDNPDSSWVHNCPFTVHATGPAKGKYGYSPRTRPWLEKNHMNYDAFIVEGIWQYHGLAVHRVLSKLQRPYYVYTHGMLDPWFKNTYPLKHLKKWLYWPWAEYQILKNAENVLFTTDEERLKARESFWLYSCKEKVVGYGTAGHFGDKQKQRELFLENYPELKGKQYFLYLSRIHPKKGLDILIEAFASYIQANPEAKLVIAGPDQVGWQKELQELAKSLSVSNNIVWTGMLHDDLKWGAYLCAEAFILPSHQENFGVVVAEALSCKLPVLISNKVDIWREVKSDKAGLVADDSLGGCIQLFNQWSELDKENKNLISTNAYNCFISRFEINHSVENLLEAIN